MSWNDTLNNGLPTITESILKVEKLLSAIREANRAGAVHEVTGLAGELGNTANYLRARSIALHFSKPMQLLPAELEEEVE